MNPNPTTLFKFIGTAQHEALAPSRPVADLKGEEYQPLQSSKPRNRVSVLVLESDYRLTSAMLFCLSRNKQLDIHLLSRVPASSYRFSRYTRSYHYFPKEKSDADFIAYIQQVAREIQAEVFVPIDVAGMRFTIAHRPQLGALMQLLPLPESESYEIATDKSRLAAFMQQHDIPAPDTIIDVRQGLAAQLDSFEFPVLLKPVDGIGGRGITLFQEAESLLRAVASLPATDSYIIQNCLEGYDIDCNVLYKDGKLVAHSIQKGLVPASSTYAPTEAIEFVRNEAVLAVVDRLMTALNWNGVAHLDLRYDARTDQIKVIEINTRFWLTVVGSAVTAKINFPVLACQSALGQPVAASTFALGRYIPFPNFIRYKLARIAKGKIPFSWRDTTIAGFLGDPLPKLYHLFKS
jgi:predicted ATP-grasp superfamily ATP-dependent carboligase